MNGLPDQIGRRLSLRRAFIKGLDPGDVYDVPIREQSMGQGVQTFQPLENL